MCINFCAGCDTAKHCSNTPEHKRPCQNIEKQSHAWAGKGITVNKSHKHAALIKAWADGAKIEGFNHQKQMWVELLNPIWNSNKEYRIKVEPKPDTVCFYYHEKNVMRALGSSNLDGTANVKYTFDGETGKLKAVELLNNFPSLINRS